MLTNVSLGLEVLGYSAGGRAGPLVLLLYLQFDCFTRNIWAHPGRAMLWNGSYELGSEGNTALTGYHRLFE
jgi:hypothetical protein